MATLPCPLPLGPQLPFLFLVKGTSLFLLICAPFAFLQEAPKARPTDTFELPVTVTHLEFEGVSHAYTKSKSNH